MNQTNATQETILNTVQGIFREVFDNPQLVITRQTSANDIEDWDSLAHVNLIVAIEKRLKIEFALGELQSLKDVGEMIDVIATKLPK